MLEAISLTKTYGERTALHALNLTIQTGEIFCLLGQNGAGKTTTINLFLGFTQATSGVAKINGVQVLPNDNTTKKFVAYIPEVVMLYGNLSGVENLDFFSRLAGFKYGIDLLEGFLSNSGLQKEAHKKRVATYSKGMRQKSRYCHRFGQKRRCHFDGRANIRPGPEGDGRIHGHL